MAALVVAITGIGALHAPHANGRVLCVGEDGHIEIEVGFEGSCTSDDGLVQSRRSQGHSAVRIESTSDVLDHCGECSDVPVRDYEEFQSVGPRVQSLNETKGSLSQVALTGLVPDSMLSSRPVEYSVQPSPFSLALKRSVSLQR